MNINTKAARGIGEKHNSSATTAAPSIAAPITTGRIEAEFTPMPAPGQTCLYRGLKRGALYSLWGDGEIETVSVRRKGLRRDDAAAVNDLNGVTRIALDDFERNREPWALTTFVERP